MPPNSGVGICNQPQLRLIRLSPVPHFIGPPSFPNPQSFNGFSRLGRIVAPNPEHALDGINIKTEPMPQEQQWDLQNNLIFNQDTFPPTPSPTSIESNEEMSSTNNQQTDQNTTVTEYQPVDPMASNMIIPDSLSSQNMNDNVSFPNELILPTSNETIYEIQVSN